MNLNLQDDEHISSERNNKNNKLGGLLGNTAIKLNLARNIIPIFDEKLFSEFQKEIYNFYINNQEYMNSPKETNSPIEENILEEDITQINWQYVLVFKNPDYDKNPILINETEAEKLYDKCFVPDGRMKNNKSQKQENDVYKFILKKTITIESSNSNSKNNLNRYKFNKGGSLLNENGKFNFKNENFKPNDIMTLIRNVTMFKLNKVLNLQTASVLSTNGEFIYILIHAPEELLKDVAQRSEYPLQYEIGITDLVSLEPCDKKLRPYLFIKDNKPEDILKLEEELLEFYTNNLYFSDEYEVLENELILDHNEISEKEWKAYREFLKFISSYKNEYLNLSTTYPNLDGLFIREMYEKAYDHVRVNLKMKILKNVWDYFGTSPIGAFKNYHRDVESTTENIQNNEDLANNENNSFYLRHIYRDGKISLFQDLDKIKLIISHLFTQLRMDRMLSLNLLVNYFPLHGRDFNSIFKEEETDKNLIILHSDDIPYSDEEVFKSTQLGDLILKEKVKNKVTTYQNVKSKWIYSFWGIVPTKEIRDYFGEKVALYYEFLSFYTFYLFILGVFGIIVYIIQHQDTIPSKAIEYFYELGFKKSRLVIGINTLYSLIVIIWGSIFLEHWKRRQSRLAIEWGQKYEEIDSEILPSFKGNKRRSPVNDQMNETFYPHFIHLMKKGLAYLISIGIVIVVIIIVLYLLYFRNWLVVNKVWGVGNKIIVNMPTVLNVIQITIFNMIYTKLAYYFNQFENHKTYSSYESSLATKIFLFQFVNSFNSLIIISFIKRWIDFMGGCVKNLQFGKTVSHYNYCDEELENQMVTIAIINFVKNFSELGVPWLLNKYKNKFHPKTKEEENKNSLLEFRRQLDYQNNLNNFNVGFIDGTFDDYLELTIQFGFVILFAMSFSLLPIIAFVTNIIEIQVDKTKLLYFNKRPNPISANSIGNWFYIFEVLSFLAIFSNIGILIFTYNNYYELTDIDKATVFIGLVSFYIIVKLVISRFIPDVSQISIEILKRHSYVVDKNYNGVVEELIPKRLFKVDYKIHGSSE